MDRSDLSQQSLTRRKLATAAIMAVVGAWPAITMAGSTTRPAVYPSTGLSPTASTTLDPSVHWFAAWNESAVAQSPANAFSGITTYNGVVQPDVSSTPTPAKSKKNPTTAHIPIVATTNPTPSYHVPTKAGSFSYIFADFETNHELFKSNPNSPTAQTHSWSIFTSPPYSEFESTLPHAVEDKRPARGNPLFVTKAQYEILHVGQGNALYPGAISILDTSAVGNAHSGSHDHSFVASASFAAAAHASFNLRGDERLYHHGVPWTSVLNDLMSVSLRPDHRNAGANKFPAVAGFAQLGGSTEHALAVNAMADQIAYFRMRGAYAANAFEQGMPGYSVADQEGDSDVDGALTDSDAAANQAKASAKRTLLAFNPTIGGTNDSESQRSEDVSTPIWAGIYALKTDRALTAEPHPTFSANSHIDYGTVDVYEVFRRRNLGASLSVAVDDDNSPITPQVALVDASIHRLLEYNPAGARDYKGTSVVVTDPSTAKPVWVLNDTYKITAKHPDDSIGMPQPTLVGILAAAAAMAVICRRRRRA